MQKLRLISSAWLFTATLLMWAISPPGQAYADPPDYCSNIPAHCEDQCAIQYSESHPGPYYQCLGHCSCISECLCDDYSEYVCVIWCQFS